ncbi:protein-L-isoaspartate O-methyltransferase family protein [Aliiruegeria sabulilitoris]|uniref:protein-L-isoaspartate O-methyltransferase family protein n=1 Tax=Aliiruegeria sabulilitoris TaxID=1510458 RepID=UPI00082F298C|nr:protein-L-isoaspartate O-methyltransferase [Aliiruegeria sabulilitoris]NDR59139.1 protein-L-isoaspartate O-methyltransferase [Pseudoruegeria sp. M32A2M]
MSSFETQRTTMVDSQIRPSDVTKYPILDALLAVPRELYVPAGQRDAAYVGNNLPLSKGRVLLEPRTFAKTLEALNVQPNEMVLDIASGYGYSTAVLAHLAEAVIALEEDETMAREAEATLSAESVDNAAVVTGLLAEGAPQHSPYDVIILQGGVVELPAAIEDQLKEGGRIGCLFMQGALGTVRIGYKIDGRINWRFSFNAAAPVLPGFEGARSFVL